MGPRAVDVDGSQVADPLIIRGRSYVCQEFGSDAEGVGDPGPPCCDCGSFLSYWSTSQAGAEECPD